MKKILPMILSLLLLLSAACAAPQSSPAPAESEASAETEAPTEAPIEFPSDPEPIVLPELPFEPEPAEEAPHASTLVVYFSRTGEQYSVGVIDEGNTAIVAKLIAEEIGADLYEILPETDTYPYTYDVLTDVAKREQNENARPAIRDAIPDLSGYDTVFIGAPVWWGDWPMILYTFFESADLSGKTLIPFSTHEGSGLAGFDRKLSAAVPGADVKKGLAIRGADCQNDRAGVQTKVQSWLNELGY